GGVGVAAGCGDAAVDICFPPLREGDLDAELITADGSWRRDLLWRCAHAFHERDQRWFGEVQWMATLVFFDEILALVEHVLEGSECRGVFDAARERAQV